MPNLLKDIFSNNDYELGAKLKFKNKKSQVSFNAALEKVYEDGKPIEVEGISTIETDYRFGGMSFPALVERKIDNVVIGPGIDKVPVKVPTEYGERVIILNHYQTKGEIVFETDSTEIVSIRVVIEKQSELIHLSYHINLSNEKRAFDVVVSLATAIGLIDRMFHSNEGEDADELSSLKRIMALTKLLFSKLSIIEGKLGINFDVREIGSLEQTLIEVEELYLLLVENKVLRMNAKLTSTESTGITFAPGATVPVVGKEINLTARGRIEYLICGREIPVHIAILMCNVVITELSVEDNGNTRIQYGDSDKGPMFYAFSAFLTEDEANAEQEEIMKNKDKYVNAMMASEYLQQEIEQL